MYKRLAAQICPLAPFLVPKGAVASIKPIRVCQASAQRVRCFASQREKKRFRQEKQAEYVLGKDRQQKEKDVQYFHESLTSNNWHEVQKGYPRVREDLSSLDTAKITQLLHYTIRKSLSKTKIIPRLFESTDAIIDDLQANRISPHPSASLHLLSILKETKQYDKGRRLWRWLVRKEDDWVDASVYGAAIELLAYAGDPLPQLESLYTQALKRYPGNFVEYHLSPEAIVPDRGQDIKLEGLPMTLLQGIVTARVLHGDWRNAYLGLDTALRLLPDLVPVRFFDLLANERPVAEATRIFRLACEAKVKLSSRLLTNLIRKMVEQQVRSSDQSTQLENIRIAVSALNLMRAQIGAGGVIVGPNISALVKGFSNLTVWCPPKTSSYEAQQKFNLAISSCAKHMLDVLLPLTTPTGSRISALNSLISLAGNAGDPHTVVYALSQITELGMQPDDVTCRCFVNAAGMCGNPWADGLWQQAWQTMVEHLRAKEQGLGEKEWITLATSCRYLSAPAARAFVEDQLLAHDADDYTRNKVERMMTQSPSVPTKPLDYDPTILSNRLKAAISQTQTQLSNNDFSALLTPLHNQPALASLEHLRIIYDELTTDPTQPPTALGPTINTSGLAYDEHRFSNWCAVNELLAMAERHQKKTDEYIDRALANGEAVGRDGVEDTRCLQYLEGKERAEVVQDTAVEYETLREAREAVLRLRGRV
ncbi:hypothetical protein EJ08DRAFT_702337 [Tothia fuscella]|uniref:Uncharacterized protein n=1 Tax=Tothia fuscella TaxID=1048955 RepID=A0A9P4TT92_9PEZI|nr:hypothetical protein EJ08DRAFT_702337 [Tothia fuscella]